MSDERLAKVDDVIAYGEVIPPNVRTLRDADGDDRPAGTIRLYVRDGDGEEAWWPMTVVEVDPEPQAAECPAHGAHPHGHRLCLDCAACRPVRGRIAEIHSPQPSGTGDREPDEREVADTHLMMTLGVDRLDGVIPAIESLLADRKTLMLVESELSITRPEDVLERLSWVVRRVGDQGREMLAVSAELAHEKTIRAGQRELLDQIADLLDVGAYDDLVETLRYRLGEASPTPAEPGPLVLTLPVVPAGAVALVFRQDPADPIRFTRVEGALPWRMVDSAGVAHYWSLIDLIAHYGPVEVVMREPRVWPQLDPAPVDMDKVEVDGVTYVRAKASGFGWTEGDKYWSWADLRELGDVREVLT